MQASGYLTLYPNGCHQTGQKSNSRRFLYLLAGVVYLLPFLYIARLFRPSQYAGSNGHTPPDYALRQPLSTIYSPLYWRTEYSAPGKAHSEIDDLWDAILPSHGFIAVDRQWAAARNWPDTMSMPNDTSKGVYLLEAYLHLHCLRIMRTTFWEAVEKRPFSHASGLRHVEHCFDALRQAIQCYADNTPLYTFGKFTAGDGQVHQCRSWNELRDFDTSHTACYRDSVEPIPLGAHFGFCDDGGDGLEEGADPM